MYKRQVLSRYNDAEVMKVLVNALMAIFIESEAPDEDVYKRQVPNVK